MLICNFTSSWSTSRKLSSIINHKPTEYLSRTSLTSWRLRPISQLRSCRRGRILLTRLSAMKFPTLETETHSSCTSLSDSGMAVKVAARKPTATFKGAGSASMDQNAQYAPTNISMSFCSIRSKNRICHRSTSWGQRAWIRRTRMAFISRKTIFRKETTIAI